MLVARQQRIEPASRELRRHLRDGEEEQDVTPPEVDEVERAPGRDGLGRADLDALLENDAG